MKTFFPIHKPHCGRLYHCNWPIYSLGTIQPGLPNVRGREQYDSADNGRRVCALSAEVQSYRIDVSRLLLFGSELVQL